MKPVPTCPQCNGNGWAVNQDGAARCDCWKSARIPRLLERAHIPARYEDASFENFQTLGNASLAEALNVAEFWAKENASLPQGLLLMGRPGRGKTHLAIAIIRYLIEKKGVSCLFCDFPDLLRQIRNSYDAATGGSERTLLAPIVDAEVLVVDDLGSMKWSEWVQDMVAHVISDRYRNNRQTIFTTNYLDPSPEEQAKRVDLRAAEVVDPAGRMDSFKLRRLRELGVISYQNEEQQWLEDRIGARLRSRLHQMCKTVTIKSNTDFRQPSAQGRRGGPDASR